MRLNKDLPPDVREALPGYRIEDAYGLRLQVAAYWSIALATQNEFELQRDYNRQVLYASSAFGGLDIRADTTEFKYGKGQVAGASLEMVTLPEGASRAGKREHPPKPSGGYAHLCDSGCGCAGTIPGATFYREIAPCERCEDPLLGGKVEWDKWQPQTGDSVWATMIGPLNSLYLANHASQRHRADGLGGPEPLV